MRNIAILLCALCMPYLFTVLWGNAGIMTGSAEADEAVPVFAPTLSEQGSDIRFLERDHVWYGEKTDTEEYVAQCLAAYAAWDMETEALKALAVVIRTGLEEGQSVLAEGGMEHAVTDRYKKAAEDTRGITISCGGGRINALWTCVSNGMTRDGAENRIASASYLKKRECRKDILSGEYSEEVSCDRRKFEAVLAELSGISAQGGELEKDDFGWPVFEQIRDSAGYTKKIRVGEKEIEGSVFADAFMLQSPSFDMEFTDEAVIFRVTGCGHGFGMSLYAADRMAEEGKDFMEILSFFYPETELKK